MDDADGDDDATGIGEDADEHAAGIEYDDDDNVDSCDIHGYCYDDDVDDADDGTGDICDYVHMFDGDDDDDDWYHDDVVDDDDASDCDKVGVTTAVVPSLSSLPSYALS